MTRMAISPRLATRRLRIRAIVCASRRDCADYLRRAIGRDSAQTIANPPLGCRAKRFLLRGPGARMGSHLNGSPESARGPWLPTRPYPPQLLGRPEPRARGNPLQVEPALRNQLLGEREPNQLYVVERRAMRVFGKQTCQIARTRAGTGR